MNSAENVWNLVIEQLKTEFTPTTMNSWFKNLKPIAFKNNTLHILAPSDIHKSHIDNIYSKKIKEVLKDIFSYDIEFIVVCGNINIDSYLNSISNGKEWDSEEFTFERFVVGSSNDYAYAAAKKVAEEPAKTYNPLFIYGGPGLGKTHLLNAIAHVVAKNHPDYRIVLKKGEELTNELVRAIQTGTTAELREKYRQADLLLIDDIQFIAGRVSTQEEFFHTFDALYESKKQIVLTSDRPPKGIYNLEERLVSRFEMGLIADVQSPSIEMRIAIVKNKSIWLNFELPDEAVNYIAENITSNIRQLEGAVKSIKARCELMNRKLDMELVVTAISDILRANPGLRPTPELIIEETANYYNVDVNDVKGQNRNKNFVLPRQISMYLIRKLTDNSLESTGKYFQGRDYTTVLHGVNKIESLVKQDKKFAETINSIIENIKNK